MSMLNILEKEISNMNVFGGNIPDIVTVIADSIPTQNIPYRMKLALAISEIMLFISQFRINIEHWNNSIIPINSIMFCIAKSGTSKDSSLKAVRKCFKKGYDLIQEQRHLNAVNRAILQATEDGCDLPNKFAVYKNYYESPNPLFVAISTTEGFVQHLNHLADDGLGAGFIFSGEVGAELSSNINLIENIKILAELYDEGTKEVKIIKSKENQSKEITNLPVSALFIGSQDNILFDENIKNKFKTEFTTKLARRSFFVFFNEEISNKFNSFTSVDALIEYENKLEDISICNRDEVSRYIKELTPKLLEQSNSIIKISEETRNLFILYKNYNEEIAKTINNLFPITKLTRFHLQWKALKLAGALALIQESTIIEIEHYKAAIEFVELINSDVNIFEKELVKESYEIFVDYVKTYAIDGKFTIGLHDLRKYGFIPTRGQSAVHLKELVKLANSYDESGNYQLINDTIQYEELAKTNYISLSYLECKGSKAYRGSHCAHGFIFQDEMMFGALSEMLSDDYAYSPFKFLNGMRGNDNIINKCKWIVLDIDSSEITDEEASFLLSDINHFVVRTSNKNNPHKFRVLIELDVEVDIPAIKWTSFIKNITQDLLSLTPDPVAKSQPFFSYKDREILSTLDAEPLKVKPYLNILNTTDIKPSKIPANKKACNNMLNDALNTFANAFNAKTSEGRRKLIWASYYAKELGADKDYVIDLIRQINNYWVKPMSEEDLNKYILNQVSRWNF